MMKTSILKRFFCVALALVLCFGIVGSHGVTPVKAVDEGSWVATTLDTVVDGEVVALGMNAHSGVYLMYNGNGTSKAPSALSVTLTEGVPSATDAPVADYGWTVTTSTVSEKKAYTFTRYGGTEWLYTTATNNGVRVGDNNNKTFWLDADSQMLQNTGTSRFLGVYKTTPDWRCYTSASGTNIVGQTLTVFKWVPASGGVPTPVDKSGYFTIGDGTNYLSADLTAATTATNSEIWKLTSTETEGVWSTTIQPYGSTELLGLNDQGALVTTGATVTEWSVYNTSGGVHLAITSGETTSYLTYDDGWKLVTEAPTTGLTLTEAMPTVDIEPNTYFVATDTKDKYMSVNKANTFYNAVVSAADAGNDEIWTVGTVDGKTTIIPYGGTDANKLGLGDNYYTSMVTESAYVSDWKAYAANEQGGIYLAIVRGTTTFYLNYDADNGDWRVSHDKQVVYLIEATPVTAESLSLKINGHSLELGDYLHVRYYVNLKENWTEAQRNSVTSSGYQLWDYTLGAEVPADATNITTYEQDGLTGFSQADDGSYYASNGGIVARHITDRYYIRAFVVVDGQYIYTDVEEYSVYVYQTLVQNAEGEMIGKFVKKELLDTVEALLLYGEYAKTAYDNAYPEA